MTLLGQATKFYNHYIEKLGWRVTVSGITPEIAVDSMVAFHEHMKAVEVCKNCKHLNPDMSCANGIDSCIINESKMSCTEWSSK